MKRRMNLIIGALIVSAFIAGSAFAGPDACGEPPRGERHKDMDKVMARKLNLTAEQDKLLKAAREAQCAGMKSIEIALEQKKEELQNAVAKPGATRAQVEPIIAQIKALKAQALDQRIDGIFKVKEILSPEQFKKLHEMRPRHLKGKRPRPEEMD